MIVLIAPSKTMDFSAAATDCAKQTQPLFPVEAKQLVDEALRLTDFNKTFSVSEKLGAKTYRELQDWGKGPRKQCLWAYRGDVYDGLDIDSFDEQQIADLNDRVRVISGLYGYLRPSDMIERYRLEMRTKLQGRGYRSLYEFWGNKIAKQLDAEKPDFLINCTSEEYMKSIRRYLPEDLRIITPRFVQIYPDARGEREPTIFTKRARGAFAAYISKLEGPIKLTDLQGFEWAEYCYSSQDSTSSEPVFKRTYSESLKST